MALSLSLAVCDYDRTRAIFDGRAAVEGCDITAVPLERFPVGMNRDSQAGWKRRFLWGDSSFRSTRWASLIHWICVPELLRR